MTRLEYISFSVLEILLFKTNSLRSTVVSLFLSWTLTSRHTSLFFFLHIFSLSRLYCFSFLTPTHRISTARIYIYIEVLLALSINCLHEIFKIITNTLGGTANDRRFAFNALSLLSTLEFISPNDAKLLLILQLITTAAISSSSNCILLSPKPTLLPAATLTFNFNLLSPCFLPPWLLSPFW